MGLAFVVGVAAYLGYRQAMKFIDKFAQKEPVELPTVRYSMPDLHAVNRRIESFLIGARAGRTNSQLILNANDLNALVANSAYSNHVYVLLTNNAVKGQISIPFEMLGMPMFSGRYLNGSGDIGVGVEGGRLTVCVNSFTVNGTRLPDHYLDWIRKQNLASRIGTNAITKESLSCVSTAGVVDESLVFQVKAQEGEGSR